MNTTVHCRSVCLSLLSVTQTAVKLLETRIDSVKAATNPPASALIPTAAAASVLPQPGAASDSQSSMPAASTSTGAAQLSVTAVEAPAGPATASTSAAAGHSGSAVPGQAQTSFAAPKASLEPSAHQTSTAAPQGAPQVTSDVLRAQTDSTATPGSADASTTGRAAKLAASGDAAVPDSIGAEGTQGFAGGSTAGLQGEAARKELADLESVLEDMYEKVEELQQIVKEQISTKNALKVSACTHPHGLLRLALLMICLYPLLLQWSA